MTFIKFPLLNSSISFFVLLLFFFPHYGYQTPCRGNNLGKWSSGGGGVPGLGSSSGDLDDYDYDSLESNAAAPPPPGLSKNCIIFSFLIALSSLFVTTKFILF